MGKTILVVDDEVSSGAALCGVLESLGHAVVRAGGPGDAASRLGQVGFDLCLAELSPRNGDGMSVLEAARRQTKPVPVIALVAEGAVRDAISALRYGAADFIPTPVNPEVAEVALRRFLDPPRRGDGWRPTHGAALIGDHPAVRLALERINQVADSEAGVLIRGEPGTGKEIVARLIHGASGRRGGPFVAVNVAALPPLLIEAELFGRPETAVDRSRRGLLERADGGTLFLDELSDLPAALQERLIAVLDGRPPHAGTAPVDVRVIAAVCRPPETLVRDRRLREDLFYKLDVIPVELPSLRERPEDIPLLAEHFRQEMNARHGRSVPGFGADVVDRLRTYEWPGNVRQLLNVVERLVIVASDRPVTVEDLPPSLRTNVMDLANAPLDLPPSGVDLRLLLSQLEQRLIGQALQRTNGNKNRAAELLGLNRTTLVEKLRRRNVA